MLIFSFGCSTQLIFMCLRWCLIAIYGRQHIYIHSINCSIFHWNLHECNNYILLQLNIKQKQNKTKTKMNNQRTVYDLKSAFTFICYKHYTVLFKIAFQIYYAYQANQNRIIEAETLCLDFYLRHYSPD